MRVETKIAIVELDPNFWSIKKRGEEIIIKAKLGIDPKPKIVINENELKIKQDIVRSVPIFVHVDSKITITDNVKKLPIKKLNFDVLGLSEYFVYKYPLENRTIWEKVLQVGAGELWKYAKEDFSVNNQYQFRIGMLKESRKEQELENSIYSVFEEFFDKVKHETIVIPLSGGYDSRLIAFMAREFGIQDRVVAICYGQRDSDETRTSKNVAKKLGIEWKFVEYSKKFIYDIVNSEEFSNYLRFHRNVPSTPHIQDFFAFKYLVEKGIISKGAVVVPGHSGDFLAGSRLKYTKGIKSLKSLVNVIVGYHSQRLFTPKIAKKSIEEYVKSVVRKNKEVELSDIFEYFDWKERQAKFIVNSVRVYEFFDLQWELPLWYKDFVDFWSSTSNEQRYNMNLYNSVLKKLFSKYTINFESVDVGTSRLREMLKALIVPSSVSFFKRTESVIKKKYKMIPLYGMYDFNNIGYDKILLNDLKRYGYGRTGTEINSIITDKSFELIMEEL